MGDGIEVTGRTEDRFSEILTPEALDFVADLHRTFNGRRRELLAARTRRQARLDAGEMPAFLPETATVRTSDWRVAAPPKDLTDRRVEITGPVERKMMINALNSGARVFMADCEDSTSPSWSNMVNGQLNLKDAVRGVIEFTGPDGREYRLNEEVATLMLRPRGWHLEEKHVIVDGDPVPGGLFDLGMYLFHNAAVLLAKGSGPYFYLPKLENHLEARLWNDVFVHAQDALGVPQGTIKATVLIENVLASFEMEEILYELREHSAGLNAGRWDYIFSVIKKFRNLPGFSLPDRGQITMTVPFMRAYTELLVKTCHKRGAHAIGGMAAFIPSRKDEDINRVAFAKVREDKERESADGCDGTWVAHPDLVPLVLGIFDEALGDRPNQVNRNRDDVVVRAGDLLDFEVAGGTVTDEGIRVNVDVGIQYLASWLRGNGAAAIYNLMEDAATSEISRSQIWQWVRHGAVTDAGEKVTLEKVTAVADAVMRDLKGTFGEENYTIGRFEDARSLFEDVALSTEFPEFLTLPAYEQVLADEQTTA